VGKKIFLCILLCGCAVGEGVFADSRIARVYFEEAGKLHASGEKEEALRLLDSALSFRPAYADALLLQSRLLAENRENRRKALLAARSAVEAGGWEFYSPGEATAHLCGLLADMRRYGEALSFLDAPASVSAPPSLEEYKLRLRCYKGLGDSKNLEATLNAALGAFSGESFFLEMFFETSDPLGPFAVRRFELLKLNPEGKLPAMAAYILASGNADNALQLAWDYFRAGGKDPAVSCLLIEKGLVDPAREMERFTVFGGLERVDLLRKIAAALRVRYPRLLAEALASFTGTAVLDKDGDGIPEEMFRIEKGRLLGWDTDEDQDGMYEISVHFGADFLPDALFYRTPDSILRCVFNGYPYVSTGTYEVDGDRHIEYYLLPCALALPLIDGVLPGEETSWLDYRLNKDFTTLAREKVEEAASRYVESAREPRGDRVVWLSAGLARQVDILRHGVVVHRLFFDEGRFSYGLRDLDRDGVFDTREFYRDGKLVALRADTTGDGKEDYAETFFPDMIKEWDIDGDGLIDAREARGEGGRPERYYKDFGGIK
jgi:tetratricopeptide (TPR) repeat protein